MSDVIFDQHPILSEYKQRINSDITVYMQHAQDSIAAQYGKVAAENANIFFEAIKQKKDRLSGILAMISYEICGGIDQVMIVRAATALEMVQAYLQLTRDVQQGGEATQLNGSARTLNAAMIGEHAAMMLVAGLEVNPEFRSNAMGIISHALLTSSHGSSYVLEQENGIPGLPQDNTQTEHIIEWCISYPLTLNPLCVGMVLAGAGCQDTDAIREYGLQIGKACAAAAQLPPKSHKKHSDYGQAAVTALNNPPAHWSSQHVALLRDIARSL